MSNAASRFLPPVILTGAQYDTLSALGLLRDGVHRYGGDGPAYVYEAEDDRMILHVVDEDGTHRRGTRGFRYDGWAPAVEGMDVVARIDWAAANGVFE